MTTALALVGLVLLFAIGQRLGSRLLRLTFRIALPVATLLLFIMMNGQQEFLGLTGVLALLFLLLFGFYIMFRGSPLFAVALGLLAISVRVPAASAVMAQSTGTATCDNFSRDDIEFHCVRDDLGFTITNEGSRRLLELYQRLGGAKALGYVRSQPFQSQRPDLKGYWFQATEHFLIQLPTGGDADPATQGARAWALDLAGTNNAWNDRLAAQYGIPKPADWGDETGKSPNEVAQLHMDTVFGPGVDPNFRDAAANLRGALDGLGTYAVLGLPVSTIQPVTVGGVLKLCVRLQAAALCRTEATGFVDPVWVGADVINNVGFMQPDPPDAFEPRIPPGVLQIDPKTPTDDVKLYDQLPSPFGFLCDGFAQLLPTCGPNEYAVPVELYEQTIKGRQPIQSADGISLTATIRRVDQNNTEFVANVPFEIGPDGQAKLPPYALPAGRYTVELFLNGKYRGITIPAPARGQEPKVAFSVARLPYPRLFGVPAVVIALAAIGTVLILVFVASRGILRWSRRSLTKPMPAYPVSVNGQQYQLDQFPDRVVRWTPWFLASRYVDGAAIGAPGLRFGTDRRGTARYVAGAGAVNGKPLGRWRGTALADGDLVELRGRAAGVRVLVGSAYGDLPMYPGVAADNWEPAYASSEAPGQGYGSVGTPAYGGELDGGRFDI